MVAVDKLDTIRIMYHKTLYPAAGNNFKVVQSYTGSAVGTSCARINVHGKRLVGIE
jgi:hypothetical protein